MHRSLSSNVCFALKNAGGEMDEGREGWGEGVWGGGYGEGGWLKLSAYSHNCLTHALFLLRGWIQFSKINLKNKTWIIIIYSTIFCQCVVIRLNLLLHTTILCDFCYINSVFGSGGCLIVCFFLGSPPPPWGEGPASTTARFIICLFI